MINKILIKKIKQIARGNLLYTAEHSAQCSVVTQMSEMGRGRRWERGPRGRGYMYTYS